MSIINRLVAYNYPKKQRLKKNSHNTIMVIIQQNKRKLNKTETKTRLYKKQTDGRTDRQPLTNLNYKTKKSKFPSEAN